MLQNSRMKHEGFFYVLFCGQIKFFGIHNKKLFTLYLHEETFETGFRNQNYFLNFRVWPKNRLEKHIINFLALYVII